MKAYLIKACALTLALTAAGTASADNNFGFGVKAGTLGLGVEGTWRPLPYLDLRLGANQYDYSDTGTQANILYDSELNLDTYYVTGNFRFPLSPFRVTAGVYSNGNEINMVSGDNGAIIIVGGDPYPSAAVGTVTSRAYRQHVALFRRGLRFLSIRQGRLESRLRRTLAGLPEG